MQNKPNFGNDKMNINLDMKSIYKNLFRWRGQKTKPIQTQLKPKQSQFKPIQTQFKAKQTQFVERPKRVPISNGTPAPQFIEKLTENAPNILNNLLIYPPFSIDNSVDYALYRVSRHIYQSKMEKVQ